MSVKNPRALEQAIASIRKDVEEAALSLDEVEAISTGSLAVDMVTGVGGFPRKRITEVSGWESSGKSTLCLTAAARAQREGIYVAYLDPENGLDKSHAERIGFNWKDESKGLYMAPDSLEGTIRIIDDLVKTDMCGLIIVDSVPALTPKSELEGEIEEVGQIAHRARLLSAFIPRLAKTINKHDTALVLVNQMRTKINTGWTARFKPYEETTPGGAALKFYSSLRLQTSLVKKGAVSRKEPHPLTGKEEDIATANLHRVEAIKNKVSAPYREAEYYIRYDTSGVYGIDNITSVVFLAAAKGVIVKGGGGYFKYTGDNNFSIQGEDKVYLHLYENPNVLQEICGTLGIDVRSL